MEGRPVTVRLLDPPLHEFLPHSEVGKEFVRVSAGEPEQGPPVGPLYIYICIRMVGRVPFFFFLVGRVPLAK